jgi:aspartate aminotransferase
MNFQSARAQQIKSSPSMVVSMEARRMRAAGDDIVDLSLGEPDLDTPPHIVEAAFRAMRAGQTRYTGPDGTEELRAAIAGKFRRDNGLGYAMDEIAVANGAKQILFSAFLATLEPGDEVIIPAPYWVSYTDIVLLHGGVPRIVECGAESGFKLTPERLVEAVGDSTRWLLLNSPSNPSGAVYSKDEYAALGEVLSPYPNVLVLSDEIYEHIIVGQQNFVSFAAACPQLGERTLLMNGVSKAYAMTGWRLGYAAGPRQLIAALNKMQSQSTTCPSSISQAAAVAALNGPQTFVREAVALYRSRCEQVTANLQAIPGLELQAPDGAFYVFPNCAGQIGRRTPDGQLIRNDTELATYLLRHGKVATVPGSAFGLEPHIRLSFAASIEQLNIALARIAQALADLS